MKSWLQKYAGRVALAGMLGMSVPLGAAPELDLEARFRELEDGSDLSPQQVKERLAIIQAKLPPGDGAAERRYRRLYCWVGFERFDEGRAYAERLLADVLKTEDRASEADTRLCLGTYLQYLGEPARAEGEFQKALELARRIGSTRLEADANGVMGQYYSFRGELGKAVGYLQNAHHLYEKANLPYWVQYNLSSIANTYRRLGDYDKALEYYQRLLAEHTQAGHKLSMGQIENEIGQVQEDMGHYAQALASYRRSEALYAANGATEVADSIGLGTGSALVHLGRYDEALKALARAKPGMEKSGDPSGLALYQEIEAEARFGLGQYDQVLALLAQAEPVFRREENGRRLALLQELRARTLAVQGNWQAAYAERLQFFETHQALDTAARERESSRLRIEFDTERKEAENKRLLAEQAFKDKELAALQSVRYWQGVVLVLAPLLLVILVCLAVRQIRRSRRLHLLAMTDELTGLANRRQIQTLAEEAMARVRQDGRKLSILVFDVDYFKRINDSYGHGVGDQVLVRVANASQAALRQQDRLGRTGGEEFLVILPNTALNQAALVAERLRAGVEAAVMSDIVEGLVVTISIGVAEYQAEDGDLRGLTRRPDNALYRAKAEGRNRVEIEL